MYLSEVIILTFGRDFANDVAKYNHVLSTVPSYATVTVCAESGLHIPNFLLSESVTILMLVVIVHYVFRALSAIIGDTTGVIFQNTRRVTRSRVIRPIKTAL